MKFPFFASFIVFILWLTYELHKHRRIEAKTEDAFWEKEAKANATRKKSLEDLPYITIPWETLPITLLTENEAIKEIQKSLQHLRVQKIVNFTGVSNTDLKLEYGAPNITLLTEYDQNYTLLARTLQKWAAVLYENQYLEEAKYLLEFAVSTKTDISASYRLLADIYIAQGEPAKIEQLLSTASTLHSAMKNTIVRILTESYPYNG